MKALKIVITIIVVITGFFIFFSPPSVEDRKKIKIDFKTILESPEKIENITILYVAKNYFRIKITDRDIIKKICNASKIDYGVRRFRGGYGDNYLIQIRINNKVYSYGFDKDYHEDALCKKKLSMDDETYYGENPYNDCGQLVLYYAPYDDRVLPYGHGNNDAYRNIDLIPVLRQYVDEEIKKNPEKYRVERPGVN